jgi:hypothetical protein
MAVAAELQNQWQAFLKLLEIREPRLFQHLQAGRIKELTKYNLLLYAHTPEDLREIEVGLKVYHDRINELLPVVFGDNRGIKTELALEQDWDDAAPQTAPAETPVPTIGIAADQNELLKVLETSIRQKLENEIRATLQAQAASPETQAKVLQKVKDDFEQEEENRRLAVRMALIAEGDKILTQLVMIWQQAKQNGDGGAQWNEVKQRLLELLDATVQLTHS